MKYLIVIEETKTADLPACVATGKTRRSVEKTMSEAIAFHLEGLKEEGYKVPKPHTYSTYVEVPA